MAQRVTKKEGVEGSAAAVDALSVIRAGRVRGTVISLFARAARNWQNAPVEIARGLREARQLHSRERRFVAEAVHGLVRMRRRLAFALGLEEDQPDAAGGALASPSADALYLAWIASQDAAHAGSVAEELHRLGAHPELLEGASARIAAIDDPIRRLAIEHSFPDWLVRRIVDDLGVDETRAFLAASNVRAPLHARANRLKIDREALAARLAKDGIETRLIEHVPDGLELLSHRNVYGLEAFREGLFELQDAASQLIGEAVAPPPRGRVLDSVRRRGREDVAPRGLAARERPHHRL